MEWWVAVSELARNFGLVAGALIGLILGGMRVLAANRQADAALRQAELARRGHVAELFNALLASSTIRSCRSDWAQSTRFGRSPKTFRTWPVPC